MAAKKPKIVQVGPEGALLWDAPEPVQIVAPSLFQRPSPSRLARLRRKYGAMLRHKSLDRPLAALNTAERYLAGLDDGNETQIDSTR